jgi:TRAP-type transport system periplasmic protein
MKYGISMLAAAGIAIVAASAAQAETKLTYGSYVPAPHVIHKAGLTPFFKRVEKDTNGSLTYELFSGGAMGGPKEALQTVKDNVVDSALIVDVYLKRDLPISTAISDLFILADSPLVYAAASNETHLLNCPECVKEKANHNMVALGFYSTGTYHLMCNRDIHTLKDAQGVKTRASSRNGALAQHWGMTPVSVTTAEMYEAMQRGQADCTLGAKAWLTSYGLKDVVKSVVSTPNGAYFGALFMNMNKDRWDSLTKDERAAIIKNLPKLVSDTVYSYMADGEKSLAEAVKKGAVVNEADDALKASLAEFRKGEIAASIAKANKAGVKNAEDIINRFLASVEKWNKIVADTGGDQAKYEAALWTEVFSKLKP